MTAERRDRDDAGQPGRHCRRIRDQWWFPQLGDRIGAPGDHGPVTLQGDGDEVPGAQRRHVAQSRRGGAFAAQTFAPPGHGSIRIKCQRMGGAGGDSLGQQPRRLPGELEV